jgi:hypothetical protein
MSNAPSEFLAMRGRRPRLTPASVFVIVAGLLACNLLGPEDDEGELTQLTAAAFDAQAAPGLEPGLS